MKKLNIQSFYFIYSINSNVKEISKINNLVTYPIKFSKINLYKTYEPLLKIISLSGHKS